MHERFRGVDRESDEMRQAFAAFLALAMREHNDRMALRDLIEFMIRHESWLLDLSPQEAFDQLSEVMQWYSEQFERQPNLLGVAMFDAPPLAYSRPTPVSELLPPEHWRL